MAQFIPRRDESPEADKHQKWLEGKVKAQDKINAELNSKLDKLLRANATSGKQVAVINARTDANTTSGNGLPPGGSTGMTVRKKLTASGGVAAAWTTEWQGLMPEYWVTLDPVAGASYYTSAMSLLSDEAADERLSQSLLPPVLFSGDGKTMYPITVGNFGDAAGGTGGQGEAPIHLYVSVVPSFDGEEFTIYPPSNDNSLGVTAPFYTFDIKNSSITNSAVIHIENTSLYYFNTDVPVMGSLTDWTFPAYTGAAWHVLNVKGWAAMAIVARNYDDGSPSDAYFASL